MTTFPYPYAALYLAHGVLEPVAIIATTETEYVAVTIGGRTIIEPHADFTIVDPTTANAIWAAQEAAGS